MLVTQNIRIGRILKDTWKVDIIMIITCTVVYALHNFFISEHLSIPLIIPTVLGTAIAFFIGFNNNQAYDRWWEARKIWGALVNDSRSWARDILCYVDGDNNSIKQQMIRRHIAFLYSLKSTLRNLEDATVQTYLSEEDFMLISKSTNKHNAILSLQSQDLEILRKNNSIDGFVFIQMDAMLVRFSDSMGMAERIKNTVFPTTYTYLTKVFIWLFVVAITFVTTEVMGFWAIFFSWMVGFVFVSTQINGMNLVNPFENKSTGIPLNQITRTIEINLLQMLGEEKIPAPVTPVNGEYVL